MTLSGNRDGEQRSAEARAARQEREAQSAAKRPWQLPLIVGVAVVLVGVAMIWTLVF